MHEGNTLFFNIAHKQIPTGRIAPLYRSADRPSCRRWDFFVREVSEAGNKMNILQHMQKIKYFLFKGWHYMWSAPKDGRKIRIIRAFDGAHVSSVVWWQDGKWVAATYPKREVVEYPFTPLMWKELEEHEITMFKELLK